MALDVPLERLQAWEKEGNDQTPTVNQLKRMAERYKRPLSSQRRRRTSCRYGTSDGFPRHS